jgi:hypothetical protein
MPGYCTLRVVSLIFSKTERGFENAFTTRIASKEPLVIVHCQPVTSCMPRQLIDRVRSKVRMPLSEPDARWIMDVYTRDLQKAESIAQRYVLASNKHIHNLKMRARLAWVDWYECKLRLSHVHQALHQQACTYLQLDVLHAWRRVYEATGTLRLRLDNLRLYVLMQSWVGWSTHLRTSARNRYAAKLGRNIVRQLVLRHWALNARCRVLAGHVLVVFKKKRTVRMIQSWAWGAEFAAFSRTIRSIFSQRRLSRCVQDWAWCARYAVVTTYALAVADGRRLQTFLNDWACRARYMAISSTASTVFEQQRLAVYLKLWARQAHYSVVSRGTGLLFEQKRVLYAARWTFANWQWKAWHTKYVGTATVHVADKLITNVMSVTLRQWCAVCTARRRRKQIETQIHGSYTKHVTLGVPFQSWRALQAYKSSLGGIQTRVHHACTKRVLREAVGAWQSETRLLALKFKCEMAWNVRLLSLCISAWSERAQTIATCVFMRVRGAKERVITCWRQVCMLRSLDRYLVKKAWDVRLTRMVKVWREDAKWRLRTNGILSGAQNKFEGRWVRQVAKELVVFWGCYASNSRSARWFVVLCMYVCVYERTCACMYTYSHMHENPKSFDFHHT